MSSARNHRIRSHRSYKNKVAVMGSIHRTNYIKGQNPFKDTFFNRLMKLLKGRKKEK